MDPRCLYGETVQIPGQVPLPSAPAKSRSLVCQSWGSLWGGRSPPRKGWPVGVSDYPIYEFPTGDGRRLSLVPTI